jgi:hypothetical protein
MLLLLKVTATDVSYQKVGKKHLKLDVEDATSDDQDKPKSETKEFHEKRVAIRKEITANFTCPIHSLENKPALCWKAPNNNTCFLISEANLNFWATKCV